MVGIGITASPTSWLPLRNPTQLVGCGMNAWFGSGQVRDETVLVVRNATSDRRLEINGHQIDIFFAAVPRGVVVTAGILIRRTLPAMARVRLQKGILNR
jgi:hypothetical protein